MKIRGLILQEVSSKHNQPGVSDSSWFKLSFSVSWPRSYGFISRLFYVWFVLCKVAPLLYILRTLVFGLPVINPTMFHTRSQFSASPMDLNDVTVLSHPTHATKNRPGIWVPRCTDHYSFVCTDGIVVSGTRAH